MIDDKEIKGVKLWTVNTAFKMAMRALCDNLGAVEGFKLYF